MLKIGTFWSIAIAVVSALVAMLVISKLFGDKPSPLFMGFFLIGLELAVGFDCVVTAIKRED